MPTNVNSAYRRAYVSAAPMRCAEAISLIWQIGHSDETHSPDECARMVLVDFRRLNSRDLMPAKALADNIQPTRQWGIAEGAVRLERKGGPDGGNE
jgi:hypothetical protein